MTTTETPPEKLGAGSQKGPVPDQNQAVLQKIQEVQQRAPHTGTYSAALIGTVCVVPIVASFVSVVLFLVLPQPLAKWLAPLGGTVSRYLPGFYWRCLTVAIPP